VLDYEIDSGVAEKGEAEEIAGDEQAADVSMVSDAGCDGLVMPEAGGELHLRLPAELGANEPSGADAVSEAGGGHAEQVGSEPNLAAYPGVAWEKLSDELSILRAQVIDMISAREEIRLDALVDPSRREDLRQSFIDYQNKGALRLEPSAQDRDLYIQYMDWQAKESTLRTHASALRRSARDADIAILRLMAANVDSNWP
jgi:hypothetical protein